MADRKLSLSTLKPAQKRADRKRVGRGMGSGKGRYSGRGIKGQKARSGSHKMRAGFEGGQMPVYMRMPKQRGPTSQDARPVGPFRTYTQGVNLRDLEARFDDGADVTIDSLLETGLIRNTRIDVKILGSGDLSKKLNVTAHRFSASAREKIEASGGTVTALREEKQERSRKRRKKKAAARAAGAIPAAEPEAAEEGQGEESAPSDSGTVPSGDSPQE
jgi:large subunit ribosomal protein L15